MIRNYLKVAARNLLSNKVFTLINILGLSFGIASVILIILFIKDEMSYDRFHEDAAHIYRIDWYSQDPQTRVPHPMAQALVRDFPEVRSAVSLSPLWGPGLTRQTFSVANPEKDIRYDETGVLSVDSTFFDVFSFEVIRGDGQAALRKPNMALLTESAAVKYFGNDDPVGKMLTINGGQVALEVGAVLKDVPANSHFHFDVLISYVTTKLYSNPNSQFYSWADFGHFNYVRLIPEADSEQLQEKLIPWAAGYLNWDSDVLERIATQNMYFQLTPITDIHLHSRIRWELEQNGNIEYVYIMSAAALFILIIACVNFMNLTTARSMDRAREIGIRKSLGAFRSQVSLQFLSESLLVSLIAMIIAGFLIEITRPMFNNITGKSLQLNYLGEPWILALLLGVGVTVGILSGLYPSIYMSRIKPALILKGSYGSQPKGRILRKSLVVTQFIISVILISGSLVIFTQLQYLKNMDLGFKKEEVIVVPFKNQLLPAQFESIRTEMKKIPGVVDISAASNIPGRAYNQNPVYLPEDIQTSINSKEMIVHYDIFSTLGIELAQGRLFSRENPADLDNSLVVNEALVRQLNIEEPIGAEITWDRDGPLFEGTIIGVVSDFNYQSLHQPIRPLLFKLEPLYNHMVIRVATEDFQNVISGISQTWKKFEQNFGFEYTFLDEDLNLQYKTEDRMGMVFGGFSFIAIILASVGLFGLASLNFAHRTREIGVRKVMGASLTRILFLLLVDFTKLILAAVIIGIPLAWLIMNNWLANFTFKIDLNPLFFAGAGLLTLLIAWVTLTYLTVRTATANPVDALRTE